jgi:hypothetical protein
MVILHAWLGPLISWQVGVIVATCSTLNITLLGRSHCCVGASLAAACHTYVSATIAISGLLESEAISANSVVSVLASMTTASYRTVQ